MQTLFDVFMERVENVVKSKYCDSCKGGNCETCCEVTKKLETIWEKNIDDPCWESDEVEDDWEFDVSDLAETNFKYTKMANGVVLSHQLNNDEEVNISDVTHPDMTIDQRVAALRLYYSEIAEHPFADDETIPEIDEQGFYGRTALHRAVLNDDVDQMETLIADGAKLDIKDNNGNTPYKLALIEGKTDIIKLFKEIGVTA